VSVNKNPDEKFIRIMIDVGNEEVIWF